MMPSTPTKPEKQPSNTTNTAPTTQRCPILKHKSVKNHTTHTDIDVRKRSQEGQKAAAAHGSNSATAICTKMI